VKTEPELQNAGFTAAGIERYENSTTAYCDQLFTRSVQNGKNDKAPDARIEVTYEHVRAAADSFIRRRQEANWLQIWCQVGEYVSAVCAGVGGGNLSQGWGTPLLVSSTAIGVILFIIRVTQKR